MYPPLLTYGRGDEWLVTRTNNFPPRLFLLSSSPPQRVVIKCSSRAFVKFMIWTVFPLFSFPPSGRCGFPRRLSFDSAPLSQFTMSFLNGERRTLVRQWFLQFWCVFVVLLSGFLLDLPRVCHGVCLPPFPWTLFHVAPFFTFRRPCAYDQAFMSASPRRSSFFPTPPFERSGSLVGFIMACPMVDLSFTIFDGSIHRLMGLFGSGFIGQVPCLKPGSPAWLVFPRV